MATFGLGVGLVGADAYIPLDNDDFDEIIATFYMSSDAAIYFDPYFESDAHAPNAYPVRAYQLHRAAGAITGNDIHAGYAENIALIYSNSYGPRSDVIGVMFDRGFATFDDPSELPLYTALPREGCAVFLDAINAARTPATEQWRQAYYTTIHELGHLFNLLHRAGRSYMAQSGSGANAPTDGFWQFVNDEEKWLAGAEVDVNVWPGGSPFRDPTGAISSADTAIAAKDFLSLQISISRDIFAFNEPVELTISLRAMKGSPAGGIEVPDEIDPGYERFAVWITDPDGEKRRYRPINHYCPSRANIVVKYRHPFVRDLSIYGQSGGFTFQKHGVHKIEAVLALSENEAVHSNAIELDITPPASLDTVTQDMLDSVSVQSFLFYRDCDQINDGYTLSSEVADIAHKPLKASLDYTLARYLDACAAANPRLKRAKGLKTTHAQRAADNAEYLGARQKNHLSKILTR